MQDAEHFLHIHYNRKESLVNVKNEPVFVKNDTFFEGVLRCAQIIDRLFVNFYKSIAIGILKKETQPPHLTLAVGYAILCV